MKKPVRNILIGILACFCLSCSKDDPAGHDGGTESVYLWIAADADTFVECAYGQTSTCKSINVDHSPAVELVVGQDTSAIKRAYVNFPLPDFPNGAHVEEAYFEMFHNGMNEDGKTDEIHVDVTIVRDSWSASGIRYETQPVEPSPFGEFSLRLKSLDWSGTANIAPEIQSVAQGEAPFEGFVIFFSRPEPGFEKVFLAGNHTSYTTDNLGMAPRLLLRVTLPKGSSAEDIDFAQTIVHPDNDGMERLGFILQTASSWPAEWEIAASR